MNSKNPNPTNKPKSRVSASIQAKDRSLAEQPKLLGSKQPGHGFFVHSKSLKDSETRFKISASRPVSKQSSMTDVVRADAKFKAEASVLEIVEKELAQALAHIEEKNKDATMMQLDIDRLQESVYELEEVG